jgi:predicted nucleotidyltransferase
MLLASHSAQTHAGDHPMTEPQVTIPQDRIVDFCQRNQIYSLSLFGSVLTEDFGPESDVDVLVEFEQQARIGFMALARIQRELTELLGRQVDLVPQDDLKPQIRESILSSRQVLYAA